MVPPKLGRCDLCLDILNFQVSKSFYINIGFDIVEEGGDTWGVLGYNDFRLGLYQGHISPMKYLLNFRGCNIAEIMQLVDVKDLEKMSNYGLNEDGTGSVSVQDTDGTTVFFDTAKDELGLADKLEYIKTTTGHVHIRTHALIPIKQFYRDLGFDLIKEDKQVLVFKNENITVHKDLAQEDQMFLELKIEDFKFTELASMYEAIDDQIKIEDPDGYMIVFRSI